MTRGRGIAWLGSLALLAAGCGQPDGAAQGVERATASIAPKQGSLVTGTAVFSREGPQVSLRIDLANAPPGELAVHIHETGDCSAADASSAGGHWNPTGEIHGRWGRPPHHLGDLGNVPVDDDGKGSLVRATDRWSLGTGAADDVVGKAIIVHAGADDYTSQPSGKAGSRIGCGVITAESTQD